MPVQVRQAGSNCEDNIQLGRRITKTEYPDSSDTGCLQGCSQLSDRGLCTGMGRAGKDPGNKETFQ